VPGVLVGSSLLEFSTSDASLEWITSTRLGVVVAHTMRFSALIVALIVCARAWEPRALTHLRQTEPDTIRAWSGSSLRSDLPMLIAAGILIAMLSLHEIESAVVLIQPGVDNLPRYVLNMLHYNRVQELNVILLALLGVGFGATLMITVVVKQMISTRTPIAALLLLSSVGSLTACSRGPSETDTALPIVSVLGEPGRSPGQFIKPRAIDTDQESIWVIDRSGRVQRLDPSGESMLEWELPDHEKGFPTGITLGADGRIYIADTHEHRVLVCRVENNSITIERAVGSYGRGAGQFFYPTDVALQTESDGVTPARYYVSEYGGNDRVSVFDNHWQFLFSFGREGYTDDPDDIAFCRPQSLLYDNRRNELLVADACNHRIGRFTHDGELLGWHENSDRATPFRHPYGLTLAPDASVLVTEFGHNRIQRIDWQSGRTLDTHGRPGRDEHGLIEPWSCAILGDLVYVLDTGKHRIVSFELPPRPEDPSR
jgi:DNA-binding beta-propeller fold protein YncE